MREPAAIAVIDGDRVHELLPFSACIELMKTVHRDLWHRRIVLPPRTFHRLRNGEFGVMPGERAVDGEPPVFGAKLISLFADNRTHGLPTIQGYVLLFEGNNGQPVALIDAASITGIRTAAASAAATDVLARPEASTLALLGYGVQARSHLTAMSCVRSLEQVRVWGPNPAKARAFAAQATQDTGLSVSAVDQVVAALDGADIVCAVSAAKTPLIQGSDLAAGTHVNLVGAHTPDTREADSASIARARVYTELTEFARREAGDLLLAERDGAFAFDDVIGEIGGVYAGAVPGRTAQDQVTLYKSLGNTAQDLICAQAVHAAALPAQGGR